MIIANNPIDNRRDLYSESFSLTVIISDMRGL